MSSYVIPGILPLWPQFDQGSEEADTDALAHAHDHRLAIAYLTMGFCFVVEIKEGHQIPVAQAAIDPEVIPHAEINHPPVQPDLVVQRPKHRCDGFLLGEGWRESAGFQEKSEE